MRVIFIADGAREENVLRNNLASISEGDSIKFIYSFNEARRFIEEQVIKYQVSVDLIITQDYIHGEHAVFFLDWLQEQTDKVYSNRDFSLSSIPVILIVNYNENKITYWDRGFSAVIDDLGADRLHRFIPEMVAPVKAWRRQVLDELDNLGIRNNSGKVDFDYFFSLRRRRNIDIRNLSENFRLIPRSLRYEWIEVNQMQIERAVDKFIKELKRSTRLGKRADEKVFHDLFNQYSFLLKRDNYSRQWHEPKMYYNDQNFWEPDYALKPNFNHNTDLSIVEIKLPNEKFISKGKFHPKPYKRLIDHLFQVNDYKDYLESDEYQREVKKAFGFSPSKIDYNILMGRIDDKHRSLEIFNKRLRHMNALHINFITYDDLLDYQVKFMERMSMLNVL
ncbi:MAG: hypothetical protein QM762_26415 [Chryseolinea sp.]